MISGGFWSDAITAFYPSDMIKARHNGSRVFKILHAYGWTRSAIGGVMACMAYISGLNPGHVNGDGFGLLHWVQGFNGLNGLEQIARMVSTVADYWDGTSPGQYPYTFAEFTALRIPPADCAEVFAVNYCAITNQQQRDEVRAIASELSNSPAFWQLVPVWLLYKRRRQPS